MPRQREDAVSASIRYFMLVSDPPLWLCVPASVIISPILCLRQRSGKIGQDEVLQFRLYAVGRLSSRRLYAGQCRMDQRPGEQPQRLDRWIPGNALRAKQRPRGHRRAGAGDAGAAGHRAVIARVREICSPTPRFQAAFVVITVFAVLLAGNRSASAQVTFVRRFGGSGSGISLDRPSP